MKSPQEPLQEPLREPSQKPASVTAPHTLLPLVVQGVSHIVDDRYLLEDIDLRLEARADDGTHAPDGPARARCTAIMGPNGAGKSLLLRVLNGLIPPGAGTIRWNGQVPDAASRRRQSLVFQRPVLLRRSVRANLDFVLKLRAGTTRDRRAVRRDALLALAGLTHREDSPARRLSGGEQQRLALVCALATEPEILFLDEPTASLDPASTAAIEHIVIDSVAHGTTVVLVTHDAGQARRLADDVVFLANGRVTEHTPGDAFFTEPRSIEARDYLAGRLVTPAAGHDPGRAVPHARTPCLTGARPACPRAACP